MMYQQQQSLLNNMFFFYSIFKIFLQSKSMWNSCYYRNKNISENGLWYINLWFKLQPNTIVRAARKKISTQGPARSWLHFDIINSTASYIKAICVVFLIWLQYSINPSSFCILKVSWRTWSISKGAHTTGTWTLWIGGPTYCRPQLHTNFHNLKLIHTLQTI